VKAAGVEVPKLNPELHLLRRHRLPHVAGVVAELE